MNPEPGEAPEERFAEWLAAGDEALASGTPLPPHPHDAPTELQSRLQRELAWCRMVRQLLPKSGSGSSHHSTSSGDFLRDSTPKPDTTSTRLGRFHIRRELGRGTFGVVFLAYDPELGREVALKVPRPEVLVTPQLRARFRQEARAAAGLEHPNLVPVYDAGEEQGVCFIASAYCPGITLAEWLRRRTEPVPYVLAAQLIATLAEAVEHAHRRGVLHRDLKPSNILLTPNPESEARNPKRIQDPSEATPEPGALNSGDSDGESVSAFGRRLSDFTPKVADFGLAKLPESEGTGFQTQSGAILGTPNYMAPEQAAGQSRVVGPPADVYALGAILYELLTGRPPFQSDTALETLMLARSQDPLAPSRLRPRVPSDLETITLKCLAKESGKRFASAQALAEDLRRYLAREPIKARRVGSVGRLALWCRRNRGLAATIVLAALVTTAVAGVAFWRVMEERDLYHTQRDESQANLYRALVGEARSQIAARDTGWWWKVQDNLRAAARIDVAIPDRAELRELAIRCLGTNAPCVRLRTTLEGHAGPVRSVAVRADSRVVASGGRDGTVRLWSLPEGRELAVLTGPAQAVSEVHFHPNGRYVVATSIDGFVYFWDIPDPDFRQKPVARRGVPLGGGAIQSSAIAPNGSCLAAACADGSVRLLPLSPETGATSEPPRVLTGHRGPVTCLTFVDGSERLASGGSDSTIRIWKVATGAPVACWPVGQAPTCLAFRAVNNALVWGDATAFGFTVRGVETGTGEVHTGVHSSSLSQVCYCSSGELLTASYDGTFKIWPRHIRRNSTELAVAREELPPVLSATVAPNDGWVVAGYHDGRVRLWELVHPASKRFLNMHTNVIQFIGAEHRLATHRSFFSFTDGEPGPEMPLRLDAVTAMGLGPAGRLLIAGYDDGSVRLWDLVEHREKHRWKAHAGSILGLACSPDGREFASASIDGAVQLWNWTGQSTARWELDLGPVCAVAWSSDGRYLGATGELGAAVWQRQASARPRRVCERAAPETSGVAFGPDMVAVCGAADTVELYDPQSGHLLRTLSGKGERIARLAFTPDGKSVLARDRAGQVILWDASTGAARAHARAGGLSVGWLAIDPRGRFFATGPMPTLIWDIETLSPVGEVYGQSTMATCAAFLADGPGCLLGMRDEAVVEVSMAEVADLAAAARVPGAPRPDHPVRIDVHTTVVAGGHSDTIWGMAASPDGRWLATAAHDGSVKLWDAQKYSLLRSWQTPGELAWCVAFSSDGRYLAAGGSDEHTGVVRVWEVESGRERCRWSGHRSLVRALAFHPQHPWLVSCATDGAIRVWDAEANQAVGLLHQFDQVVFGLAFRPDGGRLAATCQDGMLALWDWGSNPRLMAPPDVQLHGHLAGIWGVTYSPDGRYLASGADNGVITLWDGRTDEHIVTLRGATAQIRQLSFSRDSRLLAGAAYDAAPIVWDITDLRATLREMGLDWRAPGE